MTAATVASATVPPSGMRAPPRRPVFRWVWLAALVANIGTWMLTVGAQWLLIERHSTSLMISLVQSASSLPVLLLVIPAGVVADFIDTRPLLLRPGPASRPRHTRGLDHPPPASTDVHR